MEHSSLDTPEFMEYFRGGAQWAFRLFYDATINQVIGWMNKQFPRFLEPDKEDAIAKTYYIIFKNREQYADMDHVRGTLFKVIKHEMIEVYRKNSTKCKYEVEAKYLGDYKDGVPADKEPDYVPMLRKAIESLPRAMKRVIIKSFYEKKSPAEIASELSISPQTARNLRTRGIDLLIERLPFSGKKLRSHIRIT